MDHEGVFFWHFWQMYTVGPLDPHQRCALEPLGSSNCPLNPQLQGTMTVGHCMSCLRHNIHTSCDLQTTESGKNVSILMGKLRAKWGGNHQNFRENYAENSVRTLDYPQLVPKSPMIPMKNKKVQREEILLVISCLTSVTPVLTNYLNFKYFLYKNMIIHFSIRKTTKPSFLAPYFQSYFISKKGSFFWDTLYLSCL